MGSSTSPVEKLVRSAFSGDEVLLRSRSAVSSSRLAPKDRGGRNSASAVVATWAATPAGGTARQKMTARATDRVRREAPLRREWLIRFTGTTSQKFQALAAARLRTGILAALCFPPITGVEPTTGRAARGPRAEEHSRFWTGPAYGAYISCGGRCLAARRQGRTRTPSGR